MIRALVLLLVASACTRETEREPVPARVPAPTPAPPTVAPPAPTPPPLMPATEIGLVAETTSRGGQVIAIGRPRFRLMPPYYDELVVRVGTNRVLAQDRVEVKQWDLAQGILVERQVMSAAAAEPLISLMASADGAWVAAGEFGATGLYRAGTRVATTTRGIAHGFVGSAQVIAEDADGPMLVDTATGKIATRLPKLPFEAGASTLALAGDGDHVWWVTKRGYARWDRGAATFAVVTPAAKVWTEAAVALRAPIAVVRQEDGLHGLDLATGAMKKLAPRAIVFALSPTGAWTALGDVKRVRVVETNTGREVASVAVGGAVRRIAFAEVDNVLAFEDNGTIRIADVAHGRITVRPTAALSRFRGWEGDGIASIEHEGATQQLDIKTRAIGPDRGRVPAPSASLLTFTLTDRTIVARTMGRQVARLEVGDPPRPGPGLEQTYWKAVGSPTGKTFAVWVRRPDVPPELPPEERQGSHWYSDPECVHDQRGDCVIEYIAELWSVEGEAHLVWRVRPDGKRPQRGRRYLDPKVASGPMVFTPDGKHVLFGFDDGDVIVRATDASATSRVESLHRAPITRIEVAPGGRWVFTEDAEGEQRIWPL